MLCGLRAAISIEIPLVPRREIGASQLYYYFKILGNSPGFEASITMGWRSGEGEALALGATPAPHEEIEAQIPVHPLASASSRGALSRARV